MALLGFGSADKGTLSRTFKAPGEDLGPKNMTERKPLGQQRPMEPATNRNRKGDPKPAKLSREVQARLGQQLRSMYDEVVSQGVPDRFNDLLNRINASSKDRQ